MLTWRVGQISSSKISSLNLLLFLALSFIIMASILWIYSDISVNLSSRISLALQNSNLSDEVRGEPIYA